MNTIAVELKPRKLAGTPIAKKIRRAGLLPINVYGKGFENRSVVGNPKTFSRAFRSAYGRNQLFEVTIAGEEGTHLAIAKEVQLDPITRKLRHVDLFVVQPDTNITVTLPIKLDGKSAGEKIGGRLNFAERYVRAACTPQTLPTSVKVEMAPLQIGDAVMVDQMVFPDGVTAVYRKKFKVLDILQPKGGAAEEEKAAEA